MEPLKHLNLLFTSPVKAFDEVKKAGWVTPVLSLAASIGYIVNMPERVPGTNLIILKWWGLFHVAAVLAIWIAALPQGGRGSLTQVFKVVSFLTLVTGWAYFFTRTMLLLQFWALICMLTPVLFYLAIKGVHEYENDGMAFRVTASTFFIWEILVILGANLIGPNLAQASILWQ